MLETLKVLLRDFTDETITIFIVFLMFIMGVMMIYWLYNRRKFQKLTHQIPANIVKNYLDSIIQNSTALKSSLFRGGGLDIGEGIPSVLPLGNLGTGGVSSGISSEELNQKNAEIAMLSKQLSEKNRLIAELEAKLKSGGSDAGEVAKLKAEIAKLQEQLKAAMSSSGGDEVLKTKVTEVTKERDDLKERLQEYEIIEEDLANLKRLQQENEQLKKSLAGAGLSMPAAAPAAVAAAPEPAPELVEEAIAEVEAIEPEAPIEEPVAEEPVVAEAAPPPPVEEEIEMPVASTGEQKSAEELLSEFEKMLG